MGASNTDVYGNTYSNCTTNYTNSGKGTITTDTLHITGHSYVFTY